MAIFALLKAMASCSLVVDIAALIDLGLVHVLGSSSPWRETPPFFVGLAHHIMLVGHRPGLFHGGAQVAAQQGTERCSAWRMCSASAWFGD